MLDIIKVRVKNNMKNVNQTSGWWDSIRELFSPLFICLILILTSAFSVGVVIGAASTQFVTYSVAGAGAIALVSIVLLRLYELAVMLILTVHIYVDWFLGLHLVGILLALLLLL